MGRPVIFFMFFSTGFLQSHAQLISVSKTNFDLANAAIYVDENDFTVVKKSAELLQQDIKAVTGKKPALVHSISAPYPGLIVIGTIGHSSFLNELNKEKLVSTAQIEGKWEGYQIQTVDAGKKYMPMSQLLVITGSDRRGATYGVFELSRQTGVSPWYWWADVPVKKQEHVYIKENVSITDAPKVKYRGIFINDEAPALSSWSKEKFGGFNHLFYAKVFELMLRLKANYLWPAMWGSAFYDDDSLNIKTADDYGIVIGTSHHEPLMRAHDEWRRYGSGKWNYDSNEAKLKDFWRSGMQRAWNEKIVSIGMRGDGDEPMSRETATALLERIVAGQRKIIEDVTKKPAGETPQLWALYKEVQDYYDKGMRVPDDVTLLLCDDNWGNLRKLPKLNEPKRSGGYGVYYHFDYVGGPRNYKWINTSPIARVWEQMNLAWQYGVDKIWIVNVGDIKPLEFPVSFWCDYAWNPDKIGADDLQEYTEEWAAAQFGKDHAKEIAEIISKYTKYNGRRKPELLDANTYSLESGEWRRVAADYDNLYKKAEAVNTQLPGEYRNAYFELVLYPVKAMANLYDLYFNAALNKSNYEKGQADSNIVSHITINEYADKVKRDFTEDSLITLEYHHLQNGKWNYMMSQTHIGYTNWQQPPFNKMPEVKYAYVDSAQLSRMLIDKTPGVDIKQNQPPRNLFSERDGYIAAEASHFTKAINVKNITWKTLPDHGRTGDAVTTFPVTAPEQKLTSNSPHLEYEIYTHSKDSFDLYCFFSPTLNFHNVENGLQYAISIDGEAPQTVSINKEAKESKDAINYKWVAENIIIKTTKHTIGKPGRHTIKYWMVNSGVVLQKLVLDFGGLKPSYLGPEETLFK